MTDFEFQMLVFGSYNNGYDPLASVWEYPNQSLRQDGSHKWDNCAAWLSNYYINDQLAPLWHALYYVAIEHFGGTSRWMK